MNFKSPQAINIIGEERCTGCFGCYSVCPNNAIQMNINGEGFFRPLINLDICTLCGLCSNVCPVLHTKRLKEHHYSECKLKVYAAWSKDEEIVKESSSGGLFSELSRSVLDDGGFVAGAIMNNDLTVSHVVSNNEGIARRMRGSKYLQSNLGDTPKQILKLLRSGKKVLFTGTPCQVAMITLITKDHEKLYTCDLICHGVPSSLVFKHYYSSFSNNIKSFNFRDKRYGWKNYCLSFEETDKKKTFLNRKKDPFFFGYMKNIYLQKSCYDCPFCDIPRVGDITLGDYWEVEKEHFNFLGVSAVSLNSDKGVELFNEITKQIVFYETNISDLKKKNPRFNSAHFDYYEQRDHFFHDFKEKGYNYVKKKYMSQPSLPKRILWKLKRILNKVAF